MSKFSNSIVVGVFLECLPIFKHLLPGNFKKESVGFLRINPVVRRNIWQVILTFIRKQNIMKTYKISHKLYKISYKVYKISDII